MAPPPRCVHRPNGALFAGVDETRTGLLSGSSSARIILGFGPEAESSRSMPAI